MAGMDPKKAAEAVAEFHAELVRRGMSPEVATKLAGKYGRAASSEDGHCE